eukprot:g5235.t1
MAAAQSPPRTPVRTRRNSPTGDAQAIHGKDEVGAYIGSQESGISIWRSKQFFDMSAAGPRIVREELKTPGAFLLHNVLSRELCDNIVRQTEAMGYEAAKITTTAGTMRMMKEYRNSSRLIWDLNDGELDTLWKNLAPHVPPTRVDTNVLQPTGLNTRLRFLRYAPGEYFKPHFDGGYRNSLMTLIIYLSDQCAGGETRFYKGDALVDSVTPRAGTALLFYHDYHPLSPMHEGCELRQGTKHCVRTDIFFQTAET